MAASVFAARASSGNARICLRSLGDLVALGQGVLAGIPIPLCRPRCSSAQMPHGLSMSSPETDEPGFEQSASSLIWIKVECASIQRIERGWPGPFHP
ncbi:hypothetical protein AXW67_14460 [Bradyrhizobium neotropicale]|uniref:Uncharacterized protein n=1 Tax=Bradyrhizobium neotropicale TaxID=1497615 RepID=A0A176Z5Q1_9BRAD|nr:hypothetical protein AXW67_14460 [Bradyrhizobium neotropicale]